MFFDHLLDELRPLPASDRLPRIKETLAKHEKALHKKHLEGQRGTHQAKERSRMVDELFVLLFHLAVHDNGDCPDLSLCANGGYGRGLLNPGSDLDILFLTKQPAHKLPPTVDATIKSIQLVIWDLGFKFLPTTRNTNECITEAKSEPISRTAIFDSRLIIGNEPQFKTFKQRFRKECIEDDQEAFFEEREREISSRHKKYSHTVFLQEPNVKESPGGLRDYHNLEWIIDAEAGTRSQTLLIEIEILTEMARHELKEAFAFIHRVRNGLHYHDRKNDILTLRFQGVLADEFNYPEDTILRRIESFMRDYYRHTRAIRNHAKSIFEIFEIQHQEIKTNQRTFFGLIKPAPPEVIELTDYTILDSRIDAKSEHVFEQNPSRLIRVFLYCQRHDCSPSPALRKLIKASWPLIDQQLRYNPEARASFREICEHKGETAHILRLMHRCGVLGRYLPEFGALDCLVQHEFFHRYTADEHTLRCVDELDKLILEPEEKKTVYRNIFLNHPDPYALYLSLILHDTGRSENVREHIDGSAVLAAQLCKRMKVTGGRRQLIMFLVDHHLTLWSVATKQNIEDPDVINNFADIMGDRHRLDALLLFTYVDSNGTNEEAWSPWKESLILQLYRNTREFLLRRAGVASPINNLAQSDLVQEFREALSEKHHPIFDRHFISLPKRYFRYRGLKSVRAHIKTVRQFEENRAENPEAAFVCGSAWTEHPKFGYSELAIATEEQPRLLEKVCCAIAAAGLNIVSADIYTGSDGLALDLFRVCTKDQTALKDIKTEETVVSTLHQICSAPDYDPSKYLVKKRSILNPEEPQVIDFPVRALVRNDVDPHMTVVELQALDRLALLHDVFRVLHDHHLTVIHARIFTEKGAALDSIYVKTASGGKVEGEALIQQIEEELTALVGGQPVS